MPHGDTHRLEVEVRAERSDDVAAALWARGALGVWERPGVLVAWFTEQLPDAEVAEVAELAPDRRRWSIEADRDWQEDWKRTIAPVHAGRIVIVPTWLVEDHLPAPGELRLVLDPGRAFGSGHHATTTLCLEFLDDLAREGELEGRTIGDVGCGTGVLAIAAAAFGGEARAVDIDPEAVEVTRENAIRNGVVVDASVGSAADLGGACDVVVANLVTDVIVALADELVAATRRALVVSGIASGRRERAIGALVAAGAALVEVRERDGWIAARLEPTRAAAAPGGAT